LDRRADSSEPQTATISFSEIELALAAARFLAHNRHAREVIVRSMLVLAIFAVLASGLARAAAPDLAEFGWGQNKASGTRPLLVIWAREADDAPPDRLVRYRQYLQDLVFGRSASATAQPPLETELSVIGYYAEVSEARFNWKPAGFVGPVAAKVKVPATADIARAAIEAAARDAKFDFRAFDRNGDRTVAPDELTVLVIANSKLSEGQNGQFIGRAFPIPEQGVSFAGGYAVVGEGGSFATINHELFHRIARHAVDIYGNPQRCFGLHFRTALMAATIVGEVDAKMTFHPTPFDKMLVGWNEPRLHPIHVPAKAQLAAQHVPLSKAFERKQPILLYDTRKGPSEFFLLEYRTPDASGYDRNVADSGLMIWHVLLNNAKRVFLMEADRKNCKDERLPVWSLNLRGAPDWQIGVTRAYAAAHGPIALKWMSGDDSGVRITVSAHKPADATIDISWTAPETPAPFTLVQVAAATYGANCGAPPGNVTAPLAKACGGRGACTYKIDHRVIGDPKANCAKDFTVTWRCGSVSRETTAPQEASGREVYLYC
jgi:M6 family metalloprotease-like protein